jgi:hypothetical protein
VNTAQRVGDHLIFIHHQKLRRLAAKKPRALRFQCCYDDARTKIKRQITGRDPYIPTARTPLGQLVVCERARRNCKDRLLFQCGIEQLEDIRFPRTGRRLHDHVFAVA